MKDLSLHVMDIAQNSITAGATLIKVSLICCDGFLVFRLSDNGNGMDEELLKTVTDPFTTTRETRKVGMGIPLLKLSAEMTGGSFKIESVKGKAQVPKHVLLLTALTEFPWEMWMKH